MRPEQLSLDFAPRPALGREDFFVSRANAPALAMVEGARWPGGRLALTGPAASGKTHLAQVWAAASGAVVVPAADLPRLDVATLAGAGRVAVEDVPAIAGSRGAETALFHLYNRMAASRGQLLLTGRGGPAHWGMSLPDLQSRLSALTVATLEAPDDALLGALLEKQFRDRGLKPEMPTFLYLLARMPRTAEAARDLAAAIDRLSLARRRPVTRELAKDALALVFPSLHRHDDDA
jgi:chromosomal replication initiation ATPase DnaA